MDMDRWMDLELAKDKPNVGLADYVCEYTVFGKKLTMQ